MKGGITQAESQAESSPDRIVAASISEPLSKSQIAAALGLRGVTGHLNLGIHKLLTEGKISMTLPERHQTVDYKSIGFAI